MFYMRESYVLKSQGHNIDTLTYKEFLSGEHTDKYYKVMDNEIHSLMKREIWQIYSREPVYDYNVIPETWSFK